jgi:hypothetical protein
VRALRLQTCLIHTAQLRSENRTAAAALHLLELEVLLANSESLDAAGLVMVAAPRLKMRPPSANREALVVYASAQHGPRTRVEMSCHLKKLVNFNLAQRGGPRQ